MLLAAAGQSTNFGNHFYRFCSGQAYAPNAFGTDRGFVDQCYITGEEQTEGALFVIDSVQRDFYQLSGAVGTDSTGGNGGMPYDAWENAALVNTGETENVALLLSPDGGSQDLQFYIGREAACSVNSNCRSGNCQPGKCKGNRRLGQAHEEGDFFAY
jgi:hypothetical protein